MTIYEIKYRTQGNQPYFFTRDSMKFFGQTLKDFKVRKQPDGKYLIFAPMRMGGRIIGETKRLFNPTTNNLELID